MLFKLRIDTFNKEAFVSEGKGGWFSKVMGKYYNNKENK